MITPAIAAEHRGLANQLRRDVDRAGTFSLHG
jgi:hypothetical protein